MIMMQQVYMKTVNICTSGTSKKILWFKKDIFNVIHSQNVTNGPEQYLLACQLLKGVTLFIFEAASFQHGNQTVTNFKLFMANLVVHVFQKTLLI